MKLTLVAVLTVFVASCGSGSAVGNSDGGSGPSQDCTGLTKSQTVSQPCCLAFGVDACGANLFCAAFDGRTQPTCYPDRSRADMTSCTEDQQCTSGSCNITASLCRSLPGTSCTAAVGCAADPQGGKYFCNTTTMPHVCDMVGDGTLGSSCGQDSDCQSMECGGDATCLGAKGESCAIAVSGFYCSDGCSDVCNSDCGPCDRFCASGSCVRQVCGDSPDWLCQ